MQEHADHNNSEYEHFLSSVSFIFECVFLLVSLNYISDFECFPFDPAAPTLGTLQSAIPVSDKLNADLKSAYADGEAKLIQFLEEHVLTKVKSLLTLYQTINILPL